MFLLFLLLSACGTSLIYLFILCICTSLMLVLSLVSLFDNWFLVLVSYLFFGGFMCVLAYFSSFSFSSLRVSGLWSSVMCFFLCSWSVLTSKRFICTGMNELGNSWTSLSLLSMIGLITLFIVMFSVLSVNKENWGGVRIFSL